MYVHMDVFSMWSDYRECWIMGVTLNMYVHLYIRTHYTYYCIVGNFGEGFNLANWRFYGKLPNLKSAIFYSDKI